MVVMKEAWGLVEEASVDLVHKQMIFLSEDDIVALLWHKEIVGRSTWNGSKSAQYLCPLLALMIPEA